MLTVLRMTLLTDFLDSPCNPQDPQLPDIAGSSTVMPPSAEEMAALGSQRTAEVNHRPLFIGPLRRLASADGLASTTTLHTNLTAWRDCGSATQQVAVLRGLRGQ